MSCSASSYVFFSKGERDEFESMIFLIMDKAVALNQIGRLSSLLCASSTPEYFPLSGDVRGLYPRDLCFSVVFLSVKRLLKFSAVH